MLETKVSEGSKRRLQETMTYFDSNDVKTQEIRYRGMSTRFFNYTYDSRHQLLSASDREYGSSLTYTDAGKIDTADVAPVAFAPQVIPREVQYNYGNHNATDGHAV